MWISRDFRCPDCNTVTNKLMKRVEETDVIECPECGGTAGRTISVPNITSVSHIDGTDRWGDVKKKRELDKLKRKARLARDNTEMARINHELSKVADSARRGRKAETPVKKEPLK